MSWNQENDKMELKAVKNIKVALLFGILVIILVLIGMVLFLIPKAN